MRPLRPVLRALRSAFWFSFERGIGWLIRRRAASIRPVLYLPLRGALPDASAPSRFGPDWTSLLEVLAALRAIERAGDVAALIVRVGQISAGLASLSELRDALVRLRQGGVRVFAFVDHPGQPEYFLASAAERVAVPEAATLDVLGLRAEATFVRPALDWLGVVPHFEAQGAFKSYGETFTRASMSDEAREALGTVLGGLHTHWLAAVAASRSVGTEAVQAFIDGGPWTAAEARAQGFVDVVADHDAWVRALRRELAGERADGSREGPAGGPTDDPPGTASPSSLASPSPDDDDEPAPSPSLLAARLFRRGDAGWGVYPLGAWLGAHSLLDRIRRAGGTRGLVAVLVAEGTIVDSDEEHAPVGRIAPRPMAQVVKALADDDEVDAVVLRVDSPGGSAQASDRLWHELRRLARKKPLVASMGGTAASGGYYLAMAAHEVLAGASTITGSIGVVWGKFEVGPLLERLGVRTEVLSYGAHSALGSAIDGMPESLRTRLQATLRAFYESFVGKAAECRGVPKDELEPHARGRIWTGAQAAERKLVDGVGSLEDAVQRAARRAGLRPDFDVFVVEPPRPGFFERLRKLDPRILNARTPAEWAEQLAGGDRDPLRARLPFDLRFR